MKEKLKIISENSKGYEIQLPQQLVKKYKLREGDTAKFKLDFKKRTIKFVEKIKKKK